jgi:hypothetical protein
MTPVRRHLCDPYFAVRHVRAKLNHCKRCGHEPIFIEGGLDWPIYPFSGFRYFLLWCDVCGHVVRKWKQVLTRGKCHSGNAMAVSDMLAEAI